MRLQRSDTVSRWAIYLVAGCLIALCRTTNAQDSGGIITKDVGGAGVPARGIFMVVNGQDIGSSLVKACDTNQDQLASASELNAAVLNWFQRADTDSSGALSETELAAALKSLFPAPQPPPGAPPPPEEMVLHYVLAKKLMLTVDSNSDSWMTFQEALSFVSQAFAQWDADNTSSLDASEFAVAFGQLMPPPPNNKAFRTEGGPSLNAGFGY
jgi:Ca2+-binding EF-hand superfamily protein